MRFEITPEQESVVNEWLKRNVYPKLIEEQKASGQFNSSIAEDCWEMGFPYEGAIGGAVTYEFTPTSVGIVKKVRYTDRFELDLTDYGNW